MVNTGMHSVAWVVVAAIEPGMLSALYERIGGWEKLSPYLYALLTLVVGYLLAKLSSRVVRRVNRPWATEHGLMVMSRIVFYAIFLITFFTALKQVGVNLSGLLAAAGVATVAISFAAQTSVSNVVSGIFLLFDRPFSIGDNIKVDATLGTVISVGMLSSKVRTFDNLVVRIPNEVLLKSTITNYSLLSVRRVDIMVSVAHETHLKQVEVLLIEVMHRHELVLDEPAPIVLVDMISESGVQLIARVWVERGDYIKARSDLSGAATQALREAGIQRPRMQRIVYLRHEHAQGEPAGDGDTTAVVTVAGDDPA